MSASMSCWRARPAPAIAAVLSFTLAALGPLAAGEARAQSDGGSFFETFDGDWPDGSSWFVSAGWVNSEHHGCSWSADAMEQRDGRLVLSILDQASEERPFICAELQSNGVFGYGTYEARIKVPREPGSVAGFFTYTGPFFGDPHDEIDFEWVGGSPGTVQTNIWRDGDDDAVTHDLDFDPAAGFHDYAFVWQPDSVRWYVDGELLREVTDPALIPTTPGKVHLSLFSGLNVLVPWLGVYEPDGRTPQMEIEHIAYTAPGDPCQFPESLVCDAEDGS